MLQEQKTPQSEYESQKQIHISKLFLANPVGCEPPGLTYP